MMSKPFGRILVRLPCRERQLWRRQRASEQARKMLVELVTMEQLARAVEESDSEPNLIYFNFSMRQQLARGFPESPIRVFVYPANGHAKYWFMIKDNYYIDPYCMLAHIPSTSFIFGEYIECLREFRVRAFGALNSNRPHLMIGRESLIKAYTALMHNVSCDLETDDELCMNLFYMTKEQKGMAMNERIPSLPVGYWMSELDPEMDSDLVNGTWKFAKEGDLNQTAAKLKRLPSVGVRCNDELVAFEMCDPAGFFNNLFVMEDHRRKGLGTAVEMALTHKCILAGMTPYKTVDKNNKVVINSSQQSPLWTRWEEDGKPLTMVFQTWVSRKD